MRRALIVFFLFLAAGESSAQEIAFGRILIPLFFPDPVPGAHGSLWDVELTFFNQSDEPVLAHSWGPGCRMLCPPDWGLREIPPGVTFQPPYPGLFAEPPGAILFVDREHIDDVKIQLRIRDLSRQSETWGTEIPTVPETDFSTGPFSLLDVPVGSDFRTAVRIYVLSETGDLSPAHIRVYRRGDWNQSRSDVLVAEARVPLSGSSPGYGQWFTLNTVPELISAGRVRLEFVPQPGTAMWAFASITDDDTQHVTIVTPPRAHTAPPP